MKKIYLLSFLIILIFSFLSPFFALAQNDLEKDNLSIEFFYSSTCPHCIAEQSFLDNVERDYPSLEVNRYKISDEAHHDLLFTLAEKHNIERHVGVVPMTFIGNDYFIGFDNANGIGADIEESILRQLSSEDVSSEEKDEGIEVPLFGSVDANDYSLPVLAVLLGFLDGFNVCSLGALVLILGLVIALKSRKKILTLGGAFIGTTAIVYGLLIVFWYQLFALLSGYLGVMQMLIGLISVAGGLFFFHEFYKFRKYGPTCETSGNKIVARFSNKIQKVFKGESSILSLLGTVFLFAAVITIVEFPCSAAVPVVFAGILSQQGLSTGVYVFYIALFILFYMLDELIIFLIAVWKMDVWMTSPKFVVWATLIEGAILFLLGIYYLLGFL